MAKSNAEAMLEAAIVAQTKKAAREGKFPEMMQAMDRQGHGKIIRDTVNEHLKRNR